MEAVKDLGKIVVVAPDKPQSGMGHAITIGTPLRLHKVNAFEDIEAWQCSGTPVDCVKLAVDKVLHRKPDLCLSGINHGANHSINVIYSGTMSAALEAAIEGICAVGISYLNYSHEADLALPKKVAHEVASQVLKNSLPKNVLLNVNVPDILLSDYKGMRVCRQAVAKWEEEFSERVDPRGPPCRHSEVCGGDPQFLFEGPSRLSQGSGLCARLWRNRSLPAAGAGGFRRPGHGIVFREYLSSSDPSADQARGRRSPGQTRAGVHGNRDTGRAK